MSDTNDEKPAPIAPPVRTGSAPLRIASAVALAMAFTIGVYLLLDATRVNGLVSFTSCCSCLPRSPLSLPMSAIPGRSGRAAII